ncbi:GGDEF domain-containing protein [Deinococcus sedimenti]|uniref:GGDEF domain-containing protein n=1 Tax=Deinococcus sedimenti TaxID=1867090 RepID=A0ABQ2RZV3_9DEIO|nr:GGDEF domain-containing protein [Deinococcus sedimenti]GGR78199.1 GGDEF domain-containing protein [Deinococcus sedimenti]
MTRLPLPPLFLPLLLVATAHSVSLIFSHRAGELLTISDQLYLLVPALAALASWQVVPAARQRRLAVWAATCLSLLAGAEVYLVAVYDLRDLRAPDYGLGDALYHAYYLGLVGLLLSLGRGARVPGRLGLPEWVLDSMITGVVVAEVSWVLGLVPLLADARTTLLFKAVNVSYVVLDVIVLTLVLLRLRLSSASAWPLLLGLVSYVIADLVYLVDGPVTVPVGLADLLWTWGTVGQAVGFALLVRRDAGPGRPSAAVSLTLRTLPYLAVLTACLILIGNGLSMDLRGRGVVWFTVTVFTLVMLRQAVTLAETGRLNRALTEQAEQLARSRDEMEYRAHHDGLTGLLNREGFYQLLRAQQSGERTLLMLDLDGFKPVNDTYGHAAGDRVLREVARRIQEEGGADFRAARLGGDEFALLSLTPLESARARRCALRLVDRLSEPFAVRGGTMQLSVSVGVASAEAPLPEQALLGRADAALYQAKRAGGRRVQDALLNDRSPAASSDPPTA